MVGLSGEVKRLDAMIQTLRGEPPKKRTKPLRKRPVPKVSVQHCPVEDDPVGEGAQAADGARNLLLEIIRRAAYDWVLYRDSARQDQRRLAEDAHTWLFEEDEEHENGQLRLAEGKRITSFLVICFELDINAVTVRQAIKRLTARHVLRAKKPVEGQRPSDASPQVAVHTEVVTVQGFEALAVHSGGYFT